jgi:hypothetical protein
MGLLLEGAHGLAVGQERVVKRMEQQEEEEEEDEEQSKAPIQVPLVGWHRGEWGS